MTIKNTSFKGRGRAATKFTPQAIEKIKALLAQGVSREEIANVLDTTVGSLQATCSHFGISLRRNTQRSSTPHTLNGHGSVGIAEAAAPAAPLPKYALTMGREGKEVAIDIPLTSHAVAQLALEATLRDLGTAELVAQILATAIKKDMIQEVLRDEVTPSVDTAPR